MTWPDPPPKTPPPPLLQSLSLRGFKSFAERARLEFDGGICAIIGPNGSGKSNVVEALRWVTHQARARELRTHKATELIFHGSGIQGGAGKAALGLGEVELELGLNGTTLSLSRRIYRDGTTEQDLAGRPARVRDVHAALRGTGLGPGGLAVIGQGEVSTVVQATGAALLGYLQEAAGLSRSVAARQETEQRLSQTSSSLHELALLSAQAQEQTERLRQQAQTARQERAWQLEMLALQGAQARLRAQELEEEIVSLRGAVTELESQSAALSAQILSHQTQLAAQREQALLAQAQQEAYEQRQRLLEAAQQQLEQQERYLQSLLGQRAQLEYDLAQLPAAVTSSVAITNSAAVADPAPHQAALQRTRQQIAALEQQLQTKQRLYRVAQATEQERREAQARYSAQQETWQRSLKQLEQQLQQRQTELSAAQQAHNHHHTQLAQAQQRLSEWQEQQQSRAQRRTEAQQSQAAKRQSLEYVSREAARLGASLDSYERYGEGPRRALNSEHPGIIGSVADLLDVPAAYEVALQAALGRRLEQVVVATAEDARSIIELLRVRGGRATFLPLDLLRPRTRRDSALLRVEGVVGNLADLCPSDPPQVGEALLSDTLLLQDLESATALARRHATRPRLVTLTGDLLESGGAMTGGRTRDSGPNVLSDQRRYHELQDELSLLQQQLAALGSQLEALAPLPDPGWQAQVNALSEQQRRHDQQLAQAQAARDSTQQQLEQVQRQLAALLLQQSSPVVSRPALGNPELGNPALGNPAELEQQVAALEAQLTAARHQERHHTEQAQQAREQQLAWQQAARTEQQRRALQTRLQDLQQALAAQQLTTQQAQAQVQERQTELAALPSHQNLQASEELSRHYSNLLAQQNTLRARLEETQLQVARREGGRQPVPYGCLLAGTAREWQARVQRLRRALEDLGVVNALAETELEPAEQHLKTLTEQQQDVQAAVSELQGHLKQMLSQEAQATQQAFEQTRRAFAEYVGELLGGSGELQAEYTTNNLSGLSLQVQPRGKRTRNLNLLSAGERTMAGLAFLFALGHATQAPTGRSLVPSSLPLAVLDEVDAPLDEANIRRFTHFLKLFAARGTQFIVVTHQKATMEVAQSIWGVTTDQSGASRLLSIKQE